MLRASNTLVAISNQGFHTLGIFTVNALIDNIKKLHFQILRAMPPQFHSTDATRNPVLISFIDTLLHYIQVIIKRKLIANIN